MSTDHRGVREDQATEIERIAEVLHDLNGTQHYTTHEQGYDGDDIEGVTCATGVEGHMEDAADAYHAGLRAASSGPAKEPPPDLDVETLARAMTEARASLQGYAPATYQRQAEAIAAEYIRLRSEPIAKTGEQE